MPSDQGPPLMFRPGKVAEGLLSTFAARYALGHNDAAKRLMVLALFGRTAAEYEKFGCGMTYPAMLAKLIEAVNG